MWRSSTCPAASRVSTLTLTDNALGPPIAGVPTVDGNGQGGLLGLAIAPDFATTRRQRFESWMGLHGAMTMMPDWARKMTGTYHSQLIERCVLKPNEKLKSRIVRWAVGDMPCKTMALARVARRNTAAPAVAEVIITQKPQCQVA